MRCLPNAEAYPKDIILRDGDKVSVRPLDPVGKIALLEFFERIPEEKRYYLKENVASARVIHGWTSHMGSAKVIPIVAVSVSAIVADATPPFKSRTRPSPHWRSPSRSGPGLP